MTHEAVEEGWSFTEDDDQRNQPLVDDKTRPCHLNSGIDVHIFKVKKAVKMKHISLRLVDAHLYAIGAHPMLLEQTKLQKLLRGKGLQEHVELLIDNKLLKCVSDGGPNPTRIRNGRSIHCAYSALQYITRADYQISDSRYAFNTRIHRNLVSYVKKKFFNKSYLSRVLRMAHGVPCEVSASACTQTHTSSGTYSSYIVYACFACMSTHTCTYMYIGAHTHT